jgi:cytoskeletal protein RodZ
MVPLWLILLVAILALTVIYLIWRLRQCKCSLMENFETEASSAEENDENAEPKGAKEEPKEKPEDAEPEDAEPKGAKPEGSSAEDAKARSPRAEPKEKPDTNGKEADVVDTSEGEATETPKNAKKETVSKKIADQFMNYSEMKIFNSLRDNAYSLNDIKRMIREGEINEKMIEKFLARVEAMETGSSSSSKKAVQAPVVEGFSQGGYASALFY